MYTEGDLVWAKMKGFPYWPARVVPPRKAPRKLHTFVCFFGTKDFAWILDEAIVRHCEDLLVAARLGGKKMVPKLRLAIQEIAEEACKDEFETKPNIRDEAQVERTVTVQEKLTLKYAKQQLKDGGKRQIKKKRFFGKVVPAAQRKRPHAVVIPSMEQQPMEEEESGVPQVLYPRPTQKSIGFLGIGSIGHLLVLNILKSGHKVSVWNRSPDKCEPLVREGATRGATAADVVVACDITFCCLADPEASKQMFFSPTGALRGLERCKGKEKGYVEMTSLDDRTSQEIWDAVRYTGNRYLEAQMGHSSREQCAVGKMTLLGAGNLSLFLECESVFHAISKNAFFASPEVGLAANLAVLSSALAGTVCAAMGECVAMADRLGLVRNNLLDVAKRTGYSCPAVTYMLDERVANPTSKKPLPPTVSVKNQQKDLHLAIKLSDNKALPAPVVAAANELYKHAKRLGYRNRDCSAIYLATKF